MSEDDKDIERIEAYSRRNASIKDAHLVDIHPWVMHIPTRS